LDSVLECSTRKKRRKRVESLSQELDEAYGIELQRIKNSGKQYEIAKRALSWVYFAKRPLYMEELQEALAVNLIWDIEEADEDCRDLDREDIEKPQTIIESCGSLISWDRSTDIVGFSHYTVSEFFAEHADGNIESETYIARTCLTYLCFEVFDKGPCGREEFEERVNRYRLAPYVAKYLGKHVSGSKAEEDLQDLVLSILFSRSRSLAWLQLDFNYWDCISWLKSGRRNRELHYSSYHDELYGGWEPLHFLSAWDIPFIMNRILSSSIPAIVDLMTAISHKWSRQFPLANGSIWHQDPDDLRLKPATTFTSYIVPYGEQTVKTVTPFHVACRYGSAETVKLLLSMGVEVDPVFGSHRLTPLYEAVELRHERIVKLLLEKDADVNASAGCVSRNILEAAATVGHEGIVKLLLEKGADVNSEGGNFRYALRAAASEGHEGSVKLLLEKGAEINDKGRNFGHALRAAAARGHEAIVKLLLEEGAEVNGEQGYQDTALERAAFSNHESIVKMLLEKGAEVNTQGSFHGNALQRAACQGHERIVKLLLEKGADVNIQGGDYGNALQGAAYHGHEGIVKLLLEKGADVNTQGGNYGNALQAAASGAHLPPLKSQWDEQGRYIGVTVMHTPACGNRERIVKLLLEKGAHVNAPGGVHGNALQAAISNDHEDVVKLLKESGAVLT